MRIITIQECYDSLIISNKLEEKCISQKEADELNKYIINEGLDGDNIVWGRGTVTFINYVGYIKLSSVSIEILPKISINNNPEEERKALLHMIARCGIIKVNYSEINSLKLYKMDLNEILSYLFAIKLQKELIKGPYLEYSYVEENANALKGSLVVSGQIRNIASSMPKAFCRYEEFLIDNKLNRILNYCVLKLIKSVKNQETIKILRHLQTMLSDVSQIEVSSYEINNYNFNRLNNRFEEIFILAKMILSGQATLGESGKEKAFSILFKMNDIFEKYIAKLVSNSLEEEKVYSQHSKYKLLANEKKNSGVFQLKPDIVIETKRSETIIIDTKWKSISSKYNRHGVKRDDLYQMYAYLTRYPNAKTVILLYPNNDNVKLGCERYLESWTLEENRNKKIRVYTVNLENEGNTINNLNEIIELELKS